MDSKIEVCVAKLVPNLKARFSAEKLRGFLGYFFIEDGEFHKHTPDAYSYPKIQYKKVDGKYYVVGVADYAGVLENRAHEISQIRLPESVVPISRVEVTRTVHALQNSTSSYEFLTPWIALNQTNYRKFKSVSRERRKKELERVLTGNILSFLKGVGIFIDFRLSIEITNFKSVKVRAHGNEFQAFRCRFKSNITLPGMIGLGKSVSKGFGTIGVLGDTGN